MYNMCSVSCIFIDDVKTNEYLGIVVCKLHVQQRSGDLVHFSIQ